MKKSDTFYSLPEVWDFCLEKIYDKPLYVQELLEILDKYKITKKSLILDAGCGSGFPTLNLIEKGYRVIGTDKSSEMVRQIQINAHKRDISIEAYYIMWSELSKRFDSIFDFAYCRGNSLVYAASWEQNWIVPDRSREEIRKAIRNFYDVLKPGGAFYIDLTNKNEKPHKEKLGVVETQHGPIDITWEIERDMKNKVRTWTITLKFLTSGLEKIYPSYSYLLSGDELINFFQTAGFNKIDQYVPVKGEGNYDVFIAQK